MSSIPGLGKSLELKMATHSTILTCKMHGQRSWRATVHWSHKDSDLTATEHNLVNVINIDDILSMIAEACELLGRLWQQCLSLWF